MGDPRRPRSELTLGSERSGRSGTRGRGREGTSDRCGALGGRRGRRWTRGDPGGATSVPRRVHACQTIIQAGPILTRAKAAPPSAHHRSERRDRPRADGTTHARRHRIRLRGGWGMPLPSPATTRPPPRSSGGVGLPAPLGPGLHRPGSPSTRQFGRPPVDLRSEVVTLELQNVVGLRSGPTQRPAGRPGCGQRPGHGPSSLAEPLLPRSRLVLEVGNSTRGPVRSMRRGERFPWSSAPFEPGGLRQG